jgi:predicted nucleic acid-binding protein
MLLDTNILLRLLIVDDPNHKLVFDAIDKLEKQGDEIFCTAQSLRELWHVCTRSLSANGLSRSPGETATLIDDIRRRYRVLYENADTSDDWLRIVRSENIVGAACHDANHLAIAIANRIDRILTFDVRHFNRFGAMGIDILAPKDL